jgi:uncharacterized protein YqeY
MRPNSASAHVEIRAQILGDREVRRAGELDDAEATQVIRKQVKQRQDSIESFEKGGRAELAEKEKSELAILNSYLPAAMSVEEIARLVRETIAEVWRHFARADGRGHEGARPESRWAR